MSWLAEISSIIGVPAGAATAASALYLGSVAAENEASPRALADIAAAIRKIDPGRVRQTTLHIQTLFNYTFGERQFSVRCISRSAFVTISFTLAMAVKYGIMKPSTWEDLGLDAQMPIIFAILRYIMCLIADFISLWKTRFILNFAAERRGVGALAVAVDLLVSLVVSSIAMAVVSKPEYDLIQYGAESLSGVVGPHDSNLMDYVKSLLSIAYDIPVLSIRSILVDGDLNMFNLPGIFVLSTCLTSLWALLALLSATLLHLLLPIRRFVSWYFPIDAHPIRAIGITSAALLWIGWTIIFIF
jgi:hypothetical protein